MFDTGGTATNIHNMNSPIDQFGIKSDGIGGFYVAGQQTGILTPGKNGVFAARIGLCKDLGIGPSFNTISGPSTACIGAQQTYSVPMIPGAVYNWSIPGSWTGSSSSYMISPIIGNTGGTISVTATNVCGTSGLVTKTISVIPSPVVSAAQSGSVLTASPTGLTSYQWYRNDTAITGATGVTHSITAPGAYYVIGTSSNGCFDTSNVIYIWPVSVDDVTTQSLSVYPQPNDGSSFVQLPDNMKLKELKVVNLYGAEVEKRVIRQGQRLRVELQNRTPGIYFITALTEGKRYVTKLIVR